MRNWEMRYQQPVAKLTLVFFSDLWSLKNVDVTMVTEDEAVCTGPSRRA